MDLSKDEVFLTFSIFYKYLLWSPWCSRLCKRKTCDVNNQHPTNQYKEVSLPIHPVHQVICQFKKIHASVMGMALKGETKIWPVFLVGVCFFTFNIYIFTSIMLSRTKHFGFVYSEVQRNQSYSYLGRHIPRSFFPSLSVDFLIPLKITHIIGERVSACFNNCASTCFGA